jgi:hypothetical protein
VEITFKATARCTLRPRVGPGAGSQCETVAVFESKPEPFHETVFAFEERARAWFAAQGWYVPSWSSYRDVCPFHHSRSHWNKKSPTPK